MCRKQGKQKLWDQQLPLVHYPWQGLLRCGGFWCRTVMTLRRQNAKGKQNVLLTGPREETTAGLAQPMGSWVVEEHNQKVGNQRKGTMGQSIYCSPECQPSRVRLLIGDWLGERWSRETVQGKLVSLSIACPICLASNSKNWSGQVKSGCGPYLSRAVNGEVLFCLTEPVKGPQNAC